MLKRRSQSGNILFLILLAIVLFVALNYAVMSQREGSKNASGESAAAKAAAIIQHATLVQNTINRLMLVNGCKDSEISFEQSSETGYINPNMTTARCKVFDPAGGGVSWINVDSGWVTDPAAKWAYSGYFQVVGFGTSDASATSSELTAYIPYLNRDVCIAINKSLGLTSDPVNYWDQIAGYTAAPSNYFKGTYYYHSVNGPAGNNGFPAGQPYGCVNRTDLGIGNSFAYYHVLLAR